MWVPLSAGAMAKLLFGHPCIRPSVPEITLPWCLPALRGHFRVSLTAFSIGFPCDRPPAFVRFSGGCSARHSPCTIRSLVKLLATTAAWPGSGWQPPCAWLQRCTFRSICAGKIAQCWITFQKEGNKIPCKPLSVLLCSLCGFFFYAL